MTNVKDVFNLNRANYYSGGLGYYLVIADFYTFRQCIELMFYNDFRINGAIQFKCNDISSARQIPEL